MASKTDIVYKSKNKIEYPKMYKVILLNDDYTTMEFVILVLSSIFKKNTDEAAKIMLEVHNKGRGVVGVYSYDVANTKINQVLSLAKQNQYPLKPIMEEA